MVHKDAIPQHIKKSYTYKDKAFQLILEGFFIFESSLTESFKARADGSFKEKYQI